MRLWQNIWRQGLAPQLSTLGLEALERALMSDDTRLVQGVTTSPPALESLSDWEVESACALSYCGWLGDGHATVARAAAYFERVCRLADETLREPAACRVFLHWFDETPRSEMRRQLLMEVQRALRDRQAAAA